MPVYVETPEQKIADLDPARLLYSVDETATVMGMNPRTIWTKIEFGELVAVKIGRRVMISRKTLETFIREREGYLPPRARKVQAAIDAAAESARTEGSAPPAAPVAPAAEAAP